MTSEKNTLYVGNLSYEVREEELSKLFDEKGIPTESVKIVRDQYSDRSKGFGFVDVATEEDVNKAIEALNGLQFQGRQMTVNKAKPRTKRQGGGGGGYNRNRGGDRGDRGGSRQSRW